MAGASGSYECNISLSLIFTSADCNSIKFSIEYLDPLFKKRRT